MKNLVTSNLMHQRVLKYTTQLHLKELRVLLILSQDQHPIPALFGRKASLLICASACQSFWSKFMTRVIWTYR